MNRNVAMAVGLAFALVSLAALAFTSPVVAQGVPQSMKVQGYLTDRAGGSPVPANGAYMMTFEIFDAQTGGVALATAGPLSVMVTNGLYEATIPVTTDKFAGPSRYLQITVNGELLSPRLEIVSTPYALRSESATKAETVAPGSVGPAAFAPGTVTAVSIAEGVVAAPGNGVPCAEGQSLVRQGGVWTCANPPPAPPVCPDGAFMSCYSGPAGTVNVGVCRAGLSTCRLSHTGFGPCTGEVTPSAEICDGLDNDCDGTADEGASDAIVHNNGLGQTYLICNPLGVPGNAATYTLAMAQAARAAWPVPGTDVAGTCSVGSILARETPTSCVVWAYTGSKAGYVRLNDVDICGCPTATDVTTWN